MYWGNDRKPAPSLPPPNPFAGLDLVDPEPSWLVLRHAMETGGNERKGGMTQGHLYFYTPDFTFEGIINDEIPKYPRKSEKRNPKCDGLVHFDSHSILRSANFVILRPQQQAHDGQTSFHASGL